MDNGLELCPGRYCGRDVTDVPVEAYSNVSCGLCPRAHRTDGYICQPCNQSLSPYEIIFTIFNVGLILVLILIMILRSYERHGMTSGITKHKVKLGIAGVLVFVLSIFLTLLCIEPLGSLDLWSCRIERLSDFYPALYNPRPNYGATLHCANEVAFPFITMPLLLDAIIAVLTFLILIPAFAIFSYSRELKMLYSILFILPAHVIGHVFVSGLIYYAFPYITLFVTLTSFASSFLENDSKFMDMIKTERWKILDLFILYGMSVFALIGVKTFFGANDAHYTWCLLGPIGVATISKLFLPLLTYARDNTRS